MLLSNIQKPVIMGATPTTVGGGIALPTNITVKSSLQKFVRSTKKALKATTKAIDIASKIFQKLSVRSLIKPLKQAHELVNGTKVFDIVLVPMNILNVTSHVNALVRGTPSERIDLTLETANELGSIKNNIKTFYDGLETIGSRSLTLLKLTSALNMLSVVFTITSLMTKFRNVSKMKKLCEELVEAGHLKPLTDRVSLIDFQAALAILDKHQSKDKAFCKRLFNYDCKKLEGRLSAVMQEAKSRIDSGDLKQVETGEKLLCKTLKGLERRIRSNIYSPTLSAVCALVVLVSGAILLAPVVKVVSILGTVITLSEFAYHKFSEYTFAHNLKLKRKWYEWITC